MQILGIDVGGTGIKYGIVDTVSGTLIGDKGRIATPRPATPDAVGAVLAGIVALRVKNFAITPESVTSTLSALMPSG